MNQAFNPYHEFLGLDPQLTAPTYYELLGLAPGPCDPARITAAAERALARVRSHRPGAQAAAWARLLDELAAAKACLRDPDQKAAYDQTLRHAESDAAAAPSAQRGAASQTPASLPPTESTSPYAAAGSAVPAATPAAVRNPLPPRAVRVLEGKVVAPAAARPPQPPPTAAGAPGRSGGVPEFEPVETLDVPEPAPPGPVNAHVAAPPPPRASAIPLAAAMAAFFVVLTLIMLVVAFRDREAGSTPTAPDAITPAEPPSAVPPAPAHASPSGAGAVSKPPAGASLAPGIPAFHSAAPASPPATPMALFDQPAQPPAQPTPPSDQPPPATEAPVLSGASEPTAPTVSPAVNVTPVLQQARQLLTARRFVEAGRALDQAAGTPLSPDQAERIERLRQLGQRAAEFWRLAAELSQRLQAGEEILVGEQGQRVIVVESGPLSLTIRHEGRNLSYSPELLPPGLAVAIVRGKLPEPNASQSVLLGACFATLPDRRPEHLDQARLYWDQARRGGAAVDDLFAALDDER